MKNRFEHLLYSDASRLPLVSLVPEVSRIGYRGSSSRGDAQSDDESLEVLVSLKAALRNRLEIVEGRLSGEEPVEEVVSGEQSEEQGEEPADTTEEVEKTEEVGEIKDSEEEESSTESEGSDPEQKMLIKSEKEQRPSEQRPLEQRSLEQTLERLDSDRDELLMLQVALNWIALQEETR